MYAIRSYYGTALEWIKLGKPTTLGAASGAIAGLATITPAAGFVGPNAAIIIGLIAGVVCYLAVNMKSRFKFDDSLDVVGIHGIGGVTGTILLGIFASKTVNPGGADGLLLGSGTQLIAVITSYSIHYTKLYDCHGFNAI